MTRIVLAALIVCGCSTQEPVKHGDLTQAFFARDIRFNKRQEIVNQALFHTLKRVSELEERIEKIEK